MLTRIEVDGFKNLLGFEAEFGLFNCIAGPNAVGKSNLFDAIEFLSLLADMPVKDAARSIRGEGEIRDLFWTDGEYQIPEMRFAAEMLTQPIATDDLGQKTPCVSNFFRYEVHVKLERTSAGSMSPVITHESLETIFTEANNLRFPNADIVRANLLTVDFDAPAGAPLLTSITSMSPRTRLSTAQTISESPENALFLVARREMQSWRRLALEPAVLRQHDSSDDLGEPITSHGAHLPATIYRLAHEPADDPDPEAFYAKLVTRLSDLISVQRLAIDNDQKRGLLSLEIEQRGGRAVSARGLSDGTLRFLALATLSLEREQRLLCIEEPENGIHPLRIEALLNLLDELASSPEDLASETTLRQVIINTHSSELVKLIFERSREDLLLASRPLTVGPDGRDAYVLRLHPIRRTWRCHDGVRGVMLPVVGYVGAAALGDTHASAAEDAE